MRNPEPNLQNRGVSRVHEKLSQLHQDTRDQRSLASMGEGSDVIEAIDDHIILRKDAGKEQEGSIFLPGRTAEKSRPTRGEVISVGDEVQGKSISVGDRVIYHEYAESQFFLDGKEYVSVRYRDVIGREKGEKSESSVVKTESKTLADLMNPYGEEHADE